MEAWVAVTIISALAVYVFMLWDTGRREHRWSVFVNSMMESREREREQVVSLVSALTELFRGYAKYVEEKNGQNKHGQ